MKFDDFDKKMREYERSLDQYISPELYMAARLDGRGFTRLTKEICKFEAPFDVRFRELMTEAATALMNCGFDVIYVYVGSDEISLLFSPDDNSFGRNVRKYNSTLAAEASAAFSLAAGQAATFDCRMIPLPDVKAVGDYFRWRQEDIYRNALNAYCYWTLRKAGHNAVQATQMLNSRSVDNKISLLSSYNINFDKVPSWQKRGIGLYREAYIKEGYNPISGENEKAVRNRINVEYELPVGELYSDMVTRFL